MLPEVIAETSGKRRHEPAFRKLLNTTSGLVRIATAYITDNDLLPSIEKRKVQLLTSLVPMDVASGAISLRTLRSLIEAGVQCRCLSGGPRLHAKVYMFSSESAVVTSANLTNNALNSNIEVGVRLTGDVVQELTAWFDAMWVEADVLNLRLLSKWEKAIKPLRGEYDALRKKANSKKKLPREAIPHVRSRGDLRVLLDRTAQRRFFVCNTNRRWSRGLENVMRQRKYAAAWEPFKYPTHIQDVRQGDAIFMFAKGLGIVGIGRAKAGHEILGAHDPGRVRHPDDYDEPEWRVPIDEWLVWVEHPADACPFPTMPNASFIDVTEGYSGLHKAVRWRFLRDS